ncbi:hypothetical protein [Clostridium sp. HBUAS56017]|uniref:hypothetical protein n=1 Tax=Clostridium sp. HBUAS56017 TaxID=2571128 RepID=UPI0011788A53|nr:hypothetical protein [Clostridium sp. HBUAS56017]
MKKTDIENLSISEFEKGLTQENYDYIIEEYPSIARALECYQEGAQGDTDGEDSYLDINEYFELIKEQNELLNEYSRNEE